MASNPLHVLALNFATLPLRQHLDNRMLDALRIAPVHEALGQTRQQIQTLVRLTQKQ